MTMQSMLRSCVRLTPAQVSRVGGRRLLSQSMKGPTIIDLSRFSKNNDNSRELPQEALDRDIQLRKEHFAVRKSYPPTAQPRDGEGPAVDEWTAHRKRLLYRSRQRGWLEVDLLLGSFATDHAMSMTDEEAAQYEAILNCETLDIFNMVTKQMPIPEVLQTPMMTRLQEYAATSPAGVASPTMYEKLKSKMSN
mmetsp:Transcript_4342/g.7623  ORF Transcript_4342/g.7623 Transcript_4342/m.7623 type:complete len:193 (-) Transcript_4342:2288-2866(-)